ncbi:MAG TPA: carbamoyltransferase N-terminal domain-containing protein [Myxococcales bacterium]|nr:carbamoyltransferase N-terminal domain-containing protein [Myxococcales bacterium]
MPRVLGISAHYHDAAAALVVDGEPVCAVQEERLSRRKNDPSFPLNAVEWCLDFAGLQPEELDAVVFYEKPMLKFERILTMALRGFPRTWQSFPRAMKNALGGKLWVKGIIASQLGVAGARILFAEHHRSHAAMSFLGSPSREAAILVADGVGEWATLSLGRGKVSVDGAVSLELTRELRFPHSLGMLYSAFTSYLGFEVNEGEYKVMGLAAHGKPAHAELVRRIARRTSDGGFALDLSYFDFHLAARRSHSQKLVDALGPAREPWEPIDLASPDGARWADIAASVQLVLEEILVDLAQKLHGETGLDDLCLGGGVALNGLANARILREAGFRNVYVPCAPGDAGCALGAALLADRVHFGTPHRELPQHPYWGPDLDANELAQLAREDGLPLSHAADPVPPVVQELVDGRVVGWMQGRSELGPRALGHRSILAAPHGAGMRELLNRKIKFREEFRPFAPAVPAERAAEYFDLPPGGAQMARYMSGIFPVRREWRERLAAVTHVDGTSRVQVVERAMEPRFHALLEAYGERSGIPVLLNTSFNLAGEPIVQTAAEGYSTFRRSGIDVLAAGTTLVHKRREGAQRVEEEAVA